MSTSQNPPGRSTVSAIGTGGASSSIARALPRPVLLDTGQEEWVLGTAPNRQPGTKRSLRPFVNVSVSPSGRVGDLLGRRAVDCSTPTRERRRSSRRAACRRPGPGRRQRERRRATRAASWAAGRRRAESARPRRARRGRRRPGSGRAAPSAPAASRPKRQVGVGVQVHALDLEVGRPPLAADGAGDQTESLEPLRHRQAGKRASPKPNR